jgi:hypothetical protein
MEGFVTFLLFNLTICVVADALHVHDAAGAFFILFGTIGIFAMIHYIRQRARA